MYYLTYLECKIFVQIGSTEYNTSKHKSQSKAHTPTPSSPLSNRYHIIRVLETDQMKAVNMLST